MSTLAANGPDELARELTRLTERLTGLLTRETALFEARRPLETQDFQGEKSRLATLYRREIASVKADPSRLSGAAASSTAALREATERFTMALAANGRAVEALRVLTEGVVRAVADEAAKQRDTLTGYGPGAGSSARRNAGAPSIAVNRSA